MGYLDAPRGTGLPALVERWFGTVAGKVSALFDRVRALDEPQVAVVTGDFAMTDENVVVYRGGSAIKTISLPPANGIAGVRSRPRTLLQRGTGFCYLAATGADTVNGASKMLVGPGTLLTIASDGVSEWRANTPVMTLDPGRGEARGEYKELHFVSTARGGGPVPMNLVYSLDARGHTFASQNYGIFLFATEVDLGGQVHYPIFVSVNNVQIFELDNAGNVDARAEVAGASLSSKGAQIANGGGAAPTLGTIGGSGPATAAQSGWMQIKVGGNTRWIPVWA